MQLHVLISDVDSLRLSLFRSFIFSHFIKKTHKFYKYHFNFWPVYHFMAILATFQLNKYGTRAYRSWVYMLVCKAKTFIEHLALYLLICVNKTILSVVYFYVWIDSMQKYPPREWEVMGTNTGRFLTVIYYQSPSN